VKGKEHRIPLQMDHRVASSMTLECIGLAPDSMLEAMTDLAWAQMTPNDMVPNVAPNYRSCYSRQFSALKALLPTCRHHTIHTSPLTILRDKLSNA
jgi:hypothetical protein